MKSVPSVTLSLLRTLALLPLLVATMLFVPACGDDEGGDFLIVVRSDRENLLSNGADIANVSITVLDSRSQPPGLGSRVTVALLNSEGQPTGNLNDSGEAVGIAQTDSLGIAQVRVACTQEGPLLVRVRYESQNAIMQPPIQCSPAPTGDWTLAVNAEPRRILPRGTSTITITGTTETSQGVPEGTAVALEITGTNVSFLRSGTNRLVTNLGPGGRITTNIIATEAEGTSTLCARFNDTRLGATPACTAIVVSDRQLTDAACIATFSSPRAPADGRTVTTATITVSDRNGQLVNNAEVRATTQAGTFLDAPAGNAIGTSQTVNTDSGGDATLYLRSPAQAAAADVRAQAIYTEDGAERVLDCEFSANLTFFSAPACEFDGVTPSLIGVRDSGISESGRVRFCFYAEQGQPVAAGQRVDFEWQLRLTETEFAARSALTGADGCAEVEIRSGTVAGVVEVRATLPFGDNAATCVSDPVAIRGGRPTERGWSFQCERRNIGTLLNAAGDETFSNCEIQCWTFLRDRFGNPVNRPDIQVFFASEQGTVRSPVSPDNSGRVTTVFQPNGALPVDVPPLATEPRVFSVATGATVNPRDMLVTLVAFTNGEEAFYDTNGNGSYDEGEVFVDLPEPFVDANDNDQFDAQFPFNERFFDVQTPDRPLNGSWDGPNGRWDANSVIWTQTTVLLTGAAARGSLADNGLARDPNSTLSPDFLSHFVINGVRAAPGSTGQPLFTPNTIAAVLVDRYLNPINNTGTRFTVDAEGACEADLVLDRPPVGDAAQPFGFFYRRELQSFDASGNESTTNVEFQRWRTVIDRFGNTNTTNISPRIGSSILLSVDGQGACGVTLNIQTSETDSCNDVTIGSAFPIGLNMTRGL